MRKCLTFIGISLLAGVLFAGCATTNGALLQREAYVMDHPDLSEVQAEAILAGQIMLGMSEEMVNVAWGSPTRIESVRQDDAVTHWIYGNYFVGGSLTSLYFDLEGQLVRYEVEYEPGGVGKGTTGDTAGDVITADPDRVLSREAGGKP